MFSTNSKQFTITSPKTPKITSIPSEHYTIIDLTLRLTVNSEIILTLGMSTTVQSFLKAAAHYRNYTVIVAETAPSYVSSYYPFIAKG